MGKDLLAGDESLRELAAQKEREWREVEQQRGKVLQEAVSSMTEQLKVERTKFQQLKEDFKYNLKLLGERDGELEKYDSIFAEMKMRAASKEGEISELKIKIADLETEVKREIQSKEELQQHYQHRIRQKQNEVEEYRSEKDCEVNRERKEIESLKRNLERQVLELEEELDIQRRELNTGFENAQRKREHEVRLQLDKLSADLLAQQLKNKLQVQEIEALKENQVQHEHKTESSDEKCRALEKELKQVQWQLQDASAIQQAKVDDMARKQLAAEAALSRTRQEFDRKHAELDSRLKEKEALLSAVKAGFGEDQRKLEEELRGVRGQLEESSAALRQAIWEREDAQREAQSQVEQMQEEVNHVRRQYESLVARKSETSTAAEQEAESLRHDITQLKVQLESRQRDVERYRRDLAAAGEKQGVLEQKLAQAELDWQKRCEQADTRQYEKAEDLVKTLTKNRDDAVAEQKEAMRELEHRDQLIQVLRVEREQALATLRHHGITIDRQIEVEGEQSAAAEQITQLQQQNANLRQVIRSMRSEMETLSSERPNTAQSTAGQETGGSSAMYVSQLEAEVRELKAERDAAAKLRKLDALADGEGKDGDQITAADNVMVKARLDALHDTIGQLRAEKVELSATVRKQQASIHRLQMMVDQHTTLPQQAEAELAELRYQAGASERRHEAETRRLQAQISALESQLTEAHSLADSYHKAATEANLEVSRLQQQVSAATLTAAEGQPTVNFGAQELVIQQLQDEIKRLHALRSGQPDLPVIQTLPAAEKPKTVAALEAKLRQAARHIANLAKEKQQLIEAGNRLRAQLKQQEYEPHTSAEQAGVLHPTSDDISLQQKISDKLGELEAAQYYLTKQQLTQQKKIAPNKLGMQHIEVISSSVDEEEDQPKSILKKHPTAQYSNIPPYSSSDNELRRSAEIRRSAEFRAKSVTPRRESGLMSSFSSGGGESLRDVWAMLDRGDAVSSGFGSPDATLKSTADTAAIMKMVHDEHAKRQLQHHQAGDMNQDAKTLDIVGKQASLAPKPKSPGPSRKQRPQSPPTRQKPRQKGKFTARNWNAR